MARRPRGVERRLRHGKSGGAGDPRAPRWRERASFADAAWLARLIFDEDGAACELAGSSVLELTLAMLTCWRFRVDVAEPALDGALPKDPGPATPGLNAWIRDVFGVADRPALTRLAQLAAVIEADPVAGGLATADLPWSAAALAGALRSAAGAGDGDAPEPGPITRLRLIARGVEVRRGVDLRAGARPGEALLASDDGWVEFLLDPKVAAASPVSRLDFGVRLASGDPMGTLYLRYADAPEGRITLAPRGRTRYPAYVATAGLKALRWKPDDAAGPAVFTLLTARPATPASIRDALAGPARARFDRLHPALEPGGGSGASPLESLELSRLLTRELGAHVHSDRSYAAWIRRHELRGLEAKRAWETVLLGLPSRPLVSLILHPAHDPDALEHTVSSVLAQAYPDWELHLMAATPDPAWRIRLQACAAQDARIRLRVDEGGEPAFDLNAVLDAVKGDWVGVLEPGSGLAPQALLLMMDAVSARPDVRLVYADEDALDAQGGRCEPLMKPDISPELLLGRDYLGALVLQRTCEIRRARGWRPAFGDAQGYDLALRTLGRAGGAAAHVPQVLCHHARPAGGSSGEARRRAVREHVARIGRAAQVEALEAGALRLRNGLPQPAPRVSLVIPTRDRADLLSKCVRSILERSTYPAFEIVVVDNGSVEAATHELLAELSQDARVRVLEDAGEFNFARLNNVAVAQCGGEVVGLVNNDVEVISPDWIEEMTGWAVQDEVGCVGALLHYPDGRIQHAGVVLGLGGVADHVFKGAAPETVHAHWRLGVAHEVSAVTGACLFVRKALYEAVGGLDEALKVSFNDVDFCLRVGATGRRNLLTPFAELHHHESPSRGSDMSAHNAARFEAEIRLMYARWGANILADPFYSPNLTLTSLREALRWLDE